MEIKSRPAAAMSGRHDRKHGLNMNKLMLAGLLCLSGAYAANAQAACTFLIGGPNDGETINFGSVLVQRDAAPGSILATVTVNTFNSRGLNYQCTPNTGFSTRWSAEGTTVITHNGEQLFSVGIPGIAMRVSTPGAGGTAGWYPGAFPKTVVNGGCTFGTDIVTYCGNSWGPTVFQLIKIGDTSSGTIAAPGSFRASLVNVSYLYTIAVGASTVTTVACSVLNTAVPVPLGDVNLSQFSGIGSTPGAKDFNVALNCNAGTKVNITLAGTADSSGVAGVLALSPSTGTVAQGVGVQLLHNNAPVAFGTPIATGTAASAGNYNIPLVARYYQTADAIGPGQANSSATFTMTYN
jgi:type 1 fimbria pilin